MGFHMFHNFNHMSRQENKNEVTVPTMITSVPNIKHPEYIFYSIPLVDDHVSYHLPTN